MKLIFILFGFLISFQSKSQEGHNYIEGDTLVITNSEFVLDPFQFGLKPMLLLKKQINSIDTSIYINRHVDNQFDTLFKLKIGEDQFDVFVNASETFLSKGIVYSKKFPVHHEIMIGINKDDFAKKLHLDFNKKLPNYFRIRDLEFLTWIDFHFEDNELVEISFCAISD